jgi:hypothetical protein
LYYETIVALRRNAVAFLERIINTTIRKRSDAFHSLVASACKTTSIHAPRTRFAKKLMSKFKEQLSS